MYIINCLPLVVPAMKKPPDKKFIYNSTKLVFKHIIESTTNIFDVNYSFGFWISFLIYNIPYLGYRLEMSNRQDTNKYQYERKTKATFTTKGINLVKRLEGSTLYSNVVLSYSTHLKEEEPIINPLPLEMNEYYFAIDTATSFHVCKHKELFIGEIKKANNIYVKGVGGRVKVKGYGTISLSIVDDDDKECELVISNVLCVL